MIFESFSVILRQISLGVHSYAVVHFPCLTKKSSKNRDLGLFGDTATNFTRSAFARRRLFSLSYEKILQKSRFWDFSLILRQISLGVPTVRHRLFSLSYEKILQKSRLWVFSVMLRQISLGVPTVRHRLFSLSYEKILQKSRFWVFSVILRQISLGVHSYAVVHFPTERPSV